MHAASDSQPHPPATAAETEHPPPPPPPPPSPHPPAPDAIDPGRRRGPATTRTRRDAVGRDRCRGTPDRPWSGRQRWHVGDGVDGRGSCCPGGRCAFLSASANSSWLLAISSRRAIRPVRRNSTASARLVLPVLFDPQTTAISAGRLSVCSAAPYARNPLTVSDLSLGAVKACPHLLATRKQDRPSRLDRVGAPDAFMRLHQLLRQRVGLQMLEEAVTPRCSGASKRLVWNCLSCCFPLHRKCFSPSQDALHAVVLSVDPRRSGGSFVNLHRPSAIATTWIERGREATLVLAKVLQRRKEGRAARQSWRGAGEGERYRNTNSNRLSA